MINLDEVCRFDVAFMGEVGSVAHKMHHQSMIDRLLAKALVAEHKIRRQAQAKHS
jgi:hypothetical protein